MLHTPSFNVDNFNIAEYTPSVNIAALTELYTPRFSILRFNIAAKKLSFKFDCLDPYT